MQRAVDERNTALPEDRRIRFPVGTVKTGPASSRTIDDLLHDAAALMYQRKSDKRGGVF